MLKNLNDLNILKNIFLLNFFQINIFFYINNYFFKFLLFIKIYFIHL